MAKTKRSTNFTNVSGANMAIENGHSDILQWLTQQNPSILPNVEGANMAADRGFLDILRWLSEKEIHLFYLIQMALI